MNFIFKEKLGFQHTKTTYIEDKKYFLLDILLLAVLRKIECSLGRGDCSIFLKNIRCLKNFLKYTTKLFFQYSLSNLQIVKK